MDPEIINSAELEIAVLMAINFMRADPDCNEIQILETVRRILLEQAD